MSALVDRIAEVLRTEFAPLFEHACMGPRTTDTACARVAARIAEALQPEQNRQLIEAWQAGFNQGVKAGE